MKNTRFKLLAISLAFIIWLAGCSSEPAMKTVTLVAEDIAWNITAIEAQVGQTVQLIIRNDGILDHDFVLEAAELDVLLSAGESSVVSFVIDEPGTYTYICSIPGHEEAGMIGDLVITE